MANTGMANIVQFDFYVKTLYYLMLHVLNQRCKLEVFALQSCMLRVTVCEIQVFRKLIDMEYSLAVELCALYV